MSIGPLGLISALAFQHFGKPSSQLGRVRVFPSDDQISDFVKYFVIYHDKLGAGVLEECIRSRVFMASAFIDAVRLDICGLFDQRLIFFTDGVPGIFVEAAFHDHGRLVKSWQNDERCNFVEARGLVERQRRPFDSIDDTTFQGLVNFGAGRHNSRNA